MSKNNYYNYSKPSIEKTEDSEVKESINDSVDICVDDTASSPAPTPLSTPVSEPDEELKVEEVFGVVSGCAKLNLRKEPNKDSEVICVLNAGIELMIDDEKSNDEWLSVYNAEGLNGFCMKNFVTVK